MPTVLPVPSFTPGEVIMASAQNANNNALVNAIDSKIAADGTIPFSAVPTGPAADPTTDNQFTRKAYVDNIAGGILGYVSRVTTVTPGAVYSTLSLLDVNVVNFPDLSPSRRGVRLVFHAASTVATAGSVGTLFLINGTTQYGNFRTVPGNGIHMEHVQYANNGDFPSGGNVLVQVQITGPTAALVNAAANYPIQLYAEQI